MKHNPQTSLYYPYPIRGLSIVAIFMPIGPLVQTIIRAFLYQTWNLDQNIFIQIGHVLEYGVGKNFLGGYVFYMPSVLLSAFACAFGPARGHAFTFAKAFIYTITIHFVMEIIYCLAYDWNIHNIILAMQTRQLIYLLIQWSVMALACWFVAGIFHLQDAPTKQKK